MEMKIKWSTLSESVARQIIEATIKRVDILETHPQSGPLEELLQDYPGKLQIPGGR